MLHICKGSLAVIQSLENRSEAGLPQELINQNRHRGEKYGVWGFPVLWSERACQTSLLTSSIYNQEKEDPVTDKSTCLKLIKSRWAFTMSKGMGEKKEEAGKSFCFE